MAQVDERLLDVNAHGVLRIPAEIWLALVFLILLGTVASAQDAVPTPAVIHLASEDWEDYTAADGHGLGWDVLRKVFSELVQGNSTAPFLRS